MGLLGGVGAFLAEKLSQAAGESVTYARGTETVELTAWPGSSLFAVSAPAGQARVLRADADWLFKAADLAFGGALATPQKDDCLTVVRDGLRLVYEAATPTGETVWRYSDPQRTVIRLHTRLKLKTSV